MTTGDTDVSVIDTATRTVVATVPVGSYPTRVAVSPDGSLAYVTNGLSRDVSIIDTATHTAVATVPMPLSFLIPRSLAVTPDGAFIYVGSQALDGLAIIDTATNTVVDTLLADTSVLGIA